MALNSSIDNGAGVFALQGRELYPLEQMLSTVLPLEMHRLLFTSLS